MTRAELRVLEEAERVARAQLEETIYLVQSAAGISLPSLEEIAIECDEVDAYADDICDLDELIGHLTDLKQDSLAWQKTVAAWLVARRESRTESKP
jgi:hypothetical protein